MTRTDLAEQPLTIAAGPGIAPLTLTNVRYRYDSASGTITLPFAELQGVVMAWTSHLTRPAAPDAHRSPRR